MLFKIIGSLIVLAASSMIGFAIARDCTRRPQQLRDLQSILQIFENEIVYLSNLLADAFEKLARSSNSEVTVFFKETVENIKKDNASNACEAWEKAVRENIRRTALDNEDQGIIISFGKMLGNSDLEGQIKNIRLTLAQLKLQEQKAEDMRKKNEAMYNNLGILCGLAVVIIFM